MDLSGRCALVTGGGAGPGRAIAIALARCGASVSVSDINIERAERTCEQIDDLGGSAMALHADIANRFQTANMIELTRDAFGTVDILVNATRIYHPEAMLIIDEWNWRRQLEVNITGLFFCMQLAGRVMADEGGGTIINLASAAGLEFTVPTAIGTVVSQAAVIAMTQQAARELAPHGIRVCAIATGGTGLDELAASERIRAFDPRARSVSNLTEAALFLCSDAAATATGQVLVADEGDSAE